MARDTEGDVDEERARAFGRWLVERRRALQLTQEDVAAAIDRTQEFVSRWERGIVKESFPSPEVAAGLARVLDVTMQQLWLAAGYELVPTEREDAPLAFAAARDLFGRANLSSGARAAIQATLDYAEQVERREREGLAH